MVSIGPQQTSPTSQALPHVTPQPAEARQRKDLASLIEALPLAQRTLLQLRYIGGLDLEEIAAATSLELSEVKSQYKAAMAWVKLSYFQPRATR